MPNLSKLELILCNNNLGNSSLHIENLKVGLSDIKKLKTLILDL